MPKPQIKRFDEQKQFVMTSLIRQIHAHQREADRLKINLFRELNENTGRYSYDDVQQFVDDQYKKEPFNKSSRTVIKTLNNYLDTLAREDNEPDEVTLNRYGMVRESDLTIKSFVSEAIGAAARRFAARNHVDNPSDQFLLRMIANGEIELFTYRFLEATEPRDTDLKAMTISILEVLVLGITDEENLPLQEFYGRDDPKKLRGHIKEGYNHTFKDTDSLKKFLYGHYLLT